MSWAGSQDWVTDTGPATVWSRPAQPRVTCLAGDRAPSAGESRSSKVGMSLVSEGSWEVGDVSLPSLALVCPHDYLTAPGLAAQFPENGSHPVHIHSLSLTHAHTHPPLPRQHPSLPSPAEPTTRRKFQIGNHKPVVYSRQGRII